MKKIFAAIVAIIMMFTCVAFAESSGSATETTELDMTFRDGVKFGMTQQEVVDHEKETLSVVSFGEKQDPSVTVLTTDKIDISGHPTKVQYLLRDGSMFAAVFNFFDGTVYDTMKANFTSQYGEPVAYDSEGLSNWIQSISGSHPTFNGSEYVWSWSNGITLTVAQYDGGCAAVYLKVQ